MTVTKLTVNLPTEEMEMLKELARRRNTTVTTALRQAIMGEKFLDDAVREGAKVLLKKGEEYREVVFQR